MPAQYDFKAIAEQVDVEAVAHQLQLEVTRDGRATCPFCQSKDRALELVRETNTFRCWAAPPPPGKKVLSGDCIGLWAHVKGYRGQYRAAQELSEIFQIGGPVTSTSNSSTFRKDRATAPPAHEQAPAAPRVTREATPAPERSFDPEKFWANCVYTQDLADAGVTEADAARLLIGYHTKHKHHYQGARNDDGSTAGFTRLPTDLKTVKFPQQWIGPKVVQLRRA